MQPEVADAPPEPPAWVRGVARQTWKDRAPALWAVGLLTEADLGAFERYCRTYAAWRRAMTQVERKPISRELMITLQKADEMLRRAEAAFGMNPADRVPDRVPRAPAKPKKGEGSGKARFFRPRLAG